MLLIALVSCSNHISASKESKTTNQLGQATGIPVPPSALPDAEPVEGEPPERSEERRVGEGGRSRGAPEQ
ncbi:MAG: hypothetical protein F6K19_43775 [Cyanothece sp. SIO1E1]|nr:hypothetical protein [Cyanothece sp. SIO1E1]